MHHSHPSPVPVANKYLEYQRFLQAQKDLKNNIKNARSCTDRSPPPDRPHCHERLRQKQMKEHELAMIEHENQRLRERMLKNGAFVDTHNHYVLHSLNNDKRHRDEVQHKAEIDRLQKQMDTARTSYPRKDYQVDYNKQQQVKRRITRFPTFRN